MNKDNLYTRKITKAPERPVQNSKPLFGSFDGYFKIFDIKGLRRPFGKLPLPVVITNFRIAETMKLFFCDEKIIGEIVFFSCLTFSFMETTFWLRTTNQKFAYRQFLPMGFIHLPKYISYSVTACRKKKRYARIFSRLSHGKIHADLDFLSSDTRPNCEARLDFDAASPDFLDFSCVIPARVSRRVQASYMCTAPMKGWISLGYDDDICLNKDSSVGFFELRKAYYGAYSKRIIVSGLGRVKGEAVAFNIASSISPDSYSYNDNILFAEGKKTPLPPVKITKPNGVMGKWIIQDTENMVDLVFSPISQNNKKVNAIIFRTEYQNVYGHLNGTLLTLDGSEIKLKDFPCLVKKYNIRY